MADLHHAERLRYKYDVFISYKTHDDEVIAHHVASELKRKNFRTIAGWDDDAFPIGRTTLDSITNCVENSWRTVVILTHQSIQSNWVKLEVLEAIQHSKHRNILTLRLLLYNVNERDIKFLRCGMLAEVPYLCLDTNDDKWPNKLEKHIIDEVPLSSILSVGSGLAHGLVFSHYVGFLSHVLPVLADKIRESSIYQTNQLFVSLKYYLLLPGSCEIRDDLTGYDEENDIRTTICETIEFKKDHARKPRTFKLTIYKIQQKSETFYFIADCPHVLKAICQLDDLNQADKRFQIARFYYLINEVVNHEENKGCHDIVRLILYNEMAGESLQLALLESLKEDIPSQALQTYAPEGHPWASPVQRLLSTHESCDYDVTISFLRRDNTVNAIHRFLELHNMSVYASDQDSGRLLNLPSAKWHIFILTRETINSDNVVKRLCFGMLYQNLDENCLKVLPIVVDIEPEYVPRVVKCVTVVKASEHNYCQQLLSTMKGGNITLEQALPAGDVATGLAWAYVINYLQITLLKSTRDGLDLEGRIKQCMKKNRVSCCCIMKMFVIIPKSCLMNKDIDEQANENHRCKLRNNVVVKKIDALEPVYENTGGQSERPFYLHMYEYKNLTTRKSVCFIAEYSTPHNCLHDMVYSYPFAGLKAEEMQTQGERIVELIPEILKHDTVKAKYGDMTALVELVYNDDVEESLMDAIGNRVENQTQLVHVDR